MSLPCNSLDVDLRGARFENVTLDGVDPSGARRTSIDGDSLTSRDE
ncbi:MAG: hypothetical protein AAFU73_10300 [Planctomycetota bacterium]